ncbi:N-acetyltransferase ECO1 [Yarrowia sp. B02]|nr:N-acetyltransferase ECO1 [Yarrowia sp. B02]
MKTYRAKRKYLSDSEDDVFSSSPSHSPETSPLQPSSAAKLNSKAAEAVSPCRKRAKVAKKPTKTKAPVQLTLSLGQTTSTTCQTCGMTYQVAYAPDISAHKSFHNTALNGPKWKPSVSSVVVDKAKTYTVYKSRLMSHPCVSQFLKLVNSELNAPEPILSSQAAVYVYVVDQRAVGCVLVDRVTKCRHVDVETGTLGPKEYPAVMGVSRMYVSQLFRRKGIVTKLLELAKSDFIYGMELDKKQIAFTQPSEGGLKVAEKWAGTVRVYREGE